MSVPSVESASSLPARVQQALQQLGAARQGLVVAVSGGPDSVALLHALLTLRREGSPPPLLVLAHLNHQLRGAESDADEAFVRDLHQRHLAASEAALLFTSGTRAVRTEAERTGANLEATARRLRYDWLATVARTHGVKWVATGHSADDQAETVLHHLLRGTGLQGLRGIARQRPLTPGVTLIRPLLQVSRAEILAYLEAIGQSYRLDPSNDERRYTRNRIRHELLPLLAREYNPAIRAVLSRLAEQAEEAYGEEKRAAEELLRAAEKPAAGTRIILHRPRLQAASPGLVRAMFRLLWSRQGWPRDAMTFAHWKRLETLVFGEGSASDFPGRIRVRRQREVLQLGRVDPRSAPVMKQE